MKKNDICKGRIYWDGKSGIREVLDTGLYKFYEGVADEDGLVFLCHHAMTAADIGKQRQMTRVSFAAWAREEVPPAELESRLLGFEAEKVLKHLTPTQRQYLASSDEGLSTSDLIQCHQEEHRLALACQKKGLFEDVPASVQKDSFFELKFTPLGLAVLNKVRG